jgi:hypothetical protein
MSINELQLRLAYAKDFAPHKVVYYETLIKEYYAKSGNKSHQ